MRLIRSAIMRYHATSTSICNASSRRADTTSRVDVKPQLDIAWYHMIEVQINLMNFSAVTIFLARVVGLVKTMQPGHMGTYVWLH